METTTHTSLRRTQGAANAPAAELVNPRQGKWRIRWDYRAEAAPAAEAAAQEEAGPAEAYAMASYMEAEYRHKPTAAEVEATTACAAALATALAAARWEGNTAAASPAEPSDEELEAMGLLLTGDGPAFRKAYLEAREARIQSSPTAQVLEALRTSRLRSAADVTDAEALALPLTLPTFAQLCRRAERLEKGVPLTYGGAAWRTVQAHTPQAHQPPSLATAALYARINPQHAGTKDDPIPYEQGMAFTQGLYYSQYGALYLCILTTATGYPADLRDLPTIVQPAG